MKQGNCACQIKKLDGDKILSQSTRIIKQVMFDLLGERQGLCVLKLHVKAQPHVVTGSQKHDEPHESEGMTAAMFSPCDFLSQVVFS